jgi:hypothetical protein
MWTISILVFMAIVSAVQGQDAQRPLVLLVEGRDISTSSITNVGSAGASNLQQIFRDLDVRVQRITLDEAIPEEADLVVVLGPLRRLFPAQVARLWVYLHQGGNLLVAVDPDNQTLETTNVRHQVRSSGLTTLLDRAYGILIGDTLVADRWFTNPTIADVNTTYLPVYPDIIQHPILAPLVEYDLPVWTWGARHVRVEPFGINGTATPLLYTETAYGESNPDVFPDARSEEETTPAPLELNLDEDTVGRLNVAALGENRLTGSRVMVLGDSEMLQNGYGLLLDGSTPRFPGNYVFAQRALAWLANLDVAEWPRLPDNMNWIVIDGSGADWRSNIASVSDQDTSAVPGATDIQQVRTFLDDRFLYVLVETAESPSPNTTVQLKFNTDDDSAIEDTIFIHQDGAQVISDGANPLDVLDATIAYGDGIELRIPYRVIPPHQGLDEICLAVGEEESDCLTQNVEIPLITASSLTDPVLEDHLLVTVNSINRVNLRPTPDDRETPTTTLPRGMILAALGRNEPGDWIYVQNARNAGWIAASLLAANGDLMSLPIVESA